jgi:hypothetical protein
VVSRALGFADRCTGRGGRGCAGCIERSAGLPSESALRAFFGIVDERATCAGESHSRKNGRALVVGHVVLSCAPFDGSFIVGLGRRFLPKAGWALVKWGTGRGELLENDFTPQSPAAFLAKLRLRDLCRLEQEHEVEGVALRGKVTFIAAGADSRIAHRSALGCASGQEEAMLGKFCLAAASRDKPPVLCASQAKLCYVQNTSHNVILWDGAGLETVVDAVCDTGPNRAKL